MDRMDSLSLHCLTIYSCNSIAECFSFVVIPCSCGTILRGLLVSIVDLQIERGGGNAVLCGVGRAGVVEEVGVEVEVEVRWIW